jgi:signal transduction histidine kinase/ABC-type multidrug transport system ATPase subunit
VAVATTTPAAPPTAGSETILRARGLRVQFGPLRALDAVDLDIPRGQVVALAGENGAGKSTLVRCLAGDLTPNAGQVVIDGHVVTGDPRAAARMGVAVVWKDLALCDNLDVAANLLLARETRRMMFSAGRFHRQATTVLHELGIPLPDTTAIVGTLSGGQRQLVAVARAMRDHPQLLILDEPTASLGRAELAQVEELVTRLPARGVTVLLVSHDVEQMFRLADRIVVLRHGRVVADVESDLSHPDEVGALVSGQPVDVSARRQLSRLHNLADQLASAEPSSSLSLILSALSAALENEQLGIHVRDGPDLRLGASTGLPPRVVGAWQSVPFGVAGGQVGRAASSGTAVVSEDVETAPGWGRYRYEARLAGIRSSWSVPFTGTSGVTGVITVFRPNPGAPTRDELNLVTLYAGYAASALERDRLLREVTIHNSILKTVREVLETLAGPVPLIEGLGVALLALQRGLAADEVALITAAANQMEPTCRGCAGADGTGPSADLLRVATVTLAAPSDAPVRRSTGEGGRGWHLSVGFPAPEGRAALVSRWQDGIGGPEQITLMEDAANSLRLALEREASERVRREAMALRSSQELQRKFLSWLSHELRTPLTAIRGYASSLLQTDVSWDGRSQRRFLSRISDESARLGRLVDDLLDFSAIDSGILRLHPDWCDVALVLEAARTCRAEEAASRIKVSCDPELPVVWADHDRLEQVFVNLLDNAVRHNPPGTSVIVEAAPAGESVSIAVIDDGIGPPVEGERRSRTAGAGLGLSIARGIIAAHGGTMEVEGLDPGTRCVVSLPVAKGAPDV